MTKVGRKMVKCSKCGKESEQLLVFSVNYLLGDKESNGKLLNHKQKCPYCGYEAISIDSIDTTSNSINKLKREKLVELTKEFISQTNNFEIFKIPNKLYLDYFVKLENAFKEHSFENDKRFVTYGRLDFLKEEVSQRLNDEKLKYEEPNSVWGKNKWDNRMGAFIDLWDYIRGDRWFTPSAIPEGRNFKEILSVNDQYYKEGFICEQERDILLEIINQIKEFIESKKFKESDEEGEGNNMGLFSKKNKYDIDPKDNRPQIVYGPPKEFVEKEQKEDKMVFCAYEGGDFGPSEIYSVERKGDNYKFKYGYFPDGKIPELQDESSFNVDIRTKYDYTFLVDSIKRMTTDWNKEYINSNVMDGTQWSITAEEFNIEFSGSNDFPENYNVVKKLIVRLFKNGKNNSKYDIDPEDNRPQIVYGPPQFMLDKDKKYNVDPEDNIPREVYGIPSPLKKEIDDVKDKYDVKPEQNVPQKVYGVINPNISFDKDDKESINIIINNYCLSLTKWSNKCDILYMDKSKESFIKDSIITVPIGKFDEFVQRLNKIIVFWNNEYSGDNSIEWKIKANIKDMNKNISGNGSYPHNWNEFIDLISEYEILFKKTVAYDKNNEEKIELNTSFENVVEARVKDPFFNRLICEYFRNEIKNNDTVLKLLFEDVSKYDDIFNEFTKYLVQKTYDLPNPISVEGYTAKKIAELNPSFKATGVYTFLNYLREKPDEAKDIIKKGFPNKDVIPPTLNCNYLLKLTHKPFQGAYGTKEELEKQKREPIISYYNPKMLKIIMDKIIVIVDEINVDEVKLTIPYQEGIIGNEDNYKQKKENKITLKLNESYTLHLDVYDAMESWQITLVDKKEDNSDEVKKYLKELEPEVDQILIEQGLLAIENGRKMPVFGSIHTRWAIEKRLLKERYNIDWQTPAERNPHINYD